MSPHATVTPAADPFESGLDKNAANHQPLTPLGFIQRAALIYPQRLAVVHGTRHYTWSETYARSRKLASALRQHGIGRGDVVAVMAANTPEMYEAHFGVPMAGAILNTLNTRLDATTLG
ncbi:MAG: AMP-binding protein, partial [Defluviicoccus sp.]|nr:AMP-binding protein [Defluviicoccus sp.]